MDSSPVLAQVYLMGKTGDMATQRLMKEGLNTQAIARIAAALARRLTVSPPRTSGGRRSAVSTAWNSNNGCGTLSRRYTNACQRISLRPRKYWCD